MEEGHKPVMEDVSFRMVNSTFFKTILVIEFAFAFWLPVVALGMGLFGTPIALVNIFSGLFDWYFVPLMTIGGALGFWGVCQLLAKSLDSEIKLAAKRRLIIYLVCGVLALLPVPFLFLDSVALSIFAVVPYFVTAHLIYINRGYFAN